ncbi:MAG: hypothetical protein HY074_18920 [Deltaproteobacteria bacterium]|nr:hypothetical protein [Deltaproteobacteria bacterium]
MIALAACALQFFTVTAQARSPHGSLYEGRGFHAGSCYSHPGIRRCRNKPAPECDLELFPDRNGSLHFPLDPARDALLQGRDTTDYGIYEFRVSGLDSKGRPQIVLMGIRDVSLKNWDSVQDAEAKARPISCRKVLK